MLQQHDDMVMGTPSLVKSGPTVGTSTAPSATPLVNINHEDDEAEEDEFSQLSRR